MLYRQRVYLVLFALGCSGGLVADEIEFNRDIRPLLSDNCFQCHGPDGNHREADLRLDVEADAKNYAIIPGELDNEFVDRITSDDPELIMPPPETGKRLSSDEVQLLKQWVTRGAPWQKHWAYVRPVRHEIPRISPVGGKPAEGTWIDAFLRDAQAQRKLQTARRANRITLVRRLYFDLLGLPPSPQQVAAFQADASEDAYENVVDTLLSSQHFGERMAVYWLDLVRFADTVGYHGDQDQNISPYRDYVIDAFNRNLAFDQFTREQLAGDLLPNPTIDQRTATGYNRLLQTSHEGGVQPNEYLAIYQADRVRNVSAVWMGGTLGCAQCHDHKYDPYTAKDFYSMAAFFADIDESQHFTKGTNSLPTARPPELDVLNRSERMEYRQLAEAITKLESSSDASDQARATRLTHRRKRLEKRRRRTMVTVALEKPRTVRLLPRGNWLDETGEVVLPAVPAFLGQVESTHRLTRLDLANWFTDRDEGMGLLTARVMANRFWYLMFGAGLSPSMADFGGQGTPPTHPRLLDNLAIDFARDWNVKRFIKQLVMTEAYQQASQVRRDVRQADPENQYFARQSSYRLPAEMIRDAALVAGGLLVDSVGGASVKPYQPPGYYRHLNFPVRRYAHHGDQRQYRRGVYVHWQRQFLHPMLKAFDAPSREECTAKRPRSNTPLAALVLLNDPTFVEAARGLAQRMLAADTSTDPGRIDTAYRIVLSREPTDNERSTLTQLLSASRAEYQTDHDAVDAILDVGEGRSPSIDRVELAAWTTVARTILNLSEATTRE